MSRRFAPHPGDTQQKHRFTPVTDTILSQTLSHASPLLTADLQRVLWQKGNSLHCTLKHLTILRNKGTPYISLSFASAPKEGLYCWIILTKYPKVFLFFRLLLFLTEALISIFHILHLPIDSSNSVEATLEKLLSRAECKKQIMSFL